MRYISIILVVALLFCTGMAVAVSGDGGESDNVPLGSSNVFRALVVEAASASSDPGDDTSVLPFSGVQINGQPLIMGVDVRRYDTYVQIDATVPQWDNVLTFTGMDTGVSMSEPNGSHVTGIGVTGNAISFTVEPGSSPPMIFFDLGAYTDSGDPSRPEPVWETAYNVTVNVTLQPFSTIQVNDVTLDWYSLTSAYEAPVVYANTLKTTIKVNDMLSGCSLPLDTYTSGILNFTTISATELTVEFPAGTASPTKETVFFFLYGRDENNVETPVGTGYSFDLQYDSTAYTVQVDGTSYTLSRVNDRLSNATAMTTEKTTGIQLLIDGWDYAAEGDFGYEGTLTYDGNNLWSIPAGQETGPLLIELYRSVSDTEYYVYELSLTYSKPEETEPSETDPTGTDPTSPSETDPTNPSETDPTSPSETNPTSPSETNPTDPTEPEGPTEKSTSKYSEGGSDERDTTPTQPTDPTEPASDGNQEIGLQPGNTVEEGGVSKTTVGSDDVAQLLSDLEKARQNDPDAPLIAKFEVVSSGDVSDYVFDISGEDLMALQAFAPDALVVSFDGAEVYLWLEGLQGLPVTSDQVVEIQLTNESHNGRPGADVTIHSGDEPVENLDGDYSVQLRIPYKPASGEDINALFVEYIRADGTIVPVTESYYDKEAGQMVMSSNHLSRYGVAYKPTFYSDVPQGHPANPAVTFLAARGIIGKTADGKFQPDAPINRADYTNLLTGALSAVNLAPSSFSFYQDVPATARYQAATNWVYLNNIAGPVADGSYFRPVDGIVREDMATLTDNVLHCMSLRLQPLATTPSFADEPEIAAYAKSGISRLYSYGIFPLDSDGRIFPKTVSTNGDAAIVIANLLSSL